MWAGGSIRDKSVVLWNMHIPCTEMRRYFDAEVSPLFVAEGGREYGPGSSLGHCHARLRIAAMSERAD